MFVGTDGVLYTWGRNDLGQLGHGDQTDRDVPTPLFGLPPLCEVASGAGHALVLTEDHQVLPAGIGEGLSRRVKERRSDGRREAHSYQVYSWGGNGNGQLGIGHLEEAHHTPVLVSFPKGEEIIKIACGLYFSAALSSSGSLFTWGSKDEGCLALGQIRTDVLSPTRVPPLPSPIVNFSCGRFHMAAVTEDGSLYTCGLNAFGELGMEHVLRKDTFVKVFNNVAQVACGICMTMAVTFDGKLCATGWNGDGNLGISNSVDAYYEMTFIMDNVVSVAVTNHTLIRKQDGTVWGWGANNQGQLGENQEVSIVGEPKKITWCPKISAFGCGICFSYVVDEEGDLYTVGLINDLRGNFTNELLKIPSMKFQDPIPENFNFLREKWTRVYFWVFLGKLSESSLFSHFPVEVIFNLVTLQGHVFCSAHKCG
jgi:alpha-tubulin suppressor-like RCC1 family protein